MNAVLSRDVQVNLPVSASSERRSQARVAGAALLVGVTSVFVWHLGPAVVAGQRVSGTSDVNAITRYYDHPAVLPFWWQGGVSLVAIVVFAVFFRRYLLTFAPSPVVAGLIDFASAIAIAATPLYALSAGLESALVQLASAGAPSGGGLLGVFAAWDWTYNGFTYFFEAGYMAGWAIVCWRLRAIPRWIAVVGAITAIGHVFNSQVLLTHLSDNLTLVPTAFFFVWFVATGVYLARGGRSLES